jgi:GntR family transcriptional regulator
MTTPLVERLLSALDAGSSQPLYQQLQRALRDAIEQHVLGPDDALPSERQLALDLGVSRITVRKAIDGLAGEGLLVSRQGSGNFVNARIDKNFSKLTSFSEDMRARGRTPRSEWLRRTEGTVSPEEAIKMALSPGTLVYRFHRLRYADNAPMALEYATVLASVLPLLLNEEQAALLQAQPGDAGLLVERLGYLRDGRAVELSQSFYRGDTYDFIAELNTQA